MSDDIHVEFEIRSMFIMKDTLREMGINYSECSENVVEIERPSQNIIINGDTGEISLDSDNKSELDVILQKYQVAWYKDNCIRQGNRVKEEVTASGEVILRVRR